MSRKPEAESARERPITIRFTQRESDQVDRLRGQLSRSAYFRLLVRRDAAEKGKK